MNIVRTHIHLLTPRVCGCAISLGLYKVRPQVGAEFICAENPPKENQLSEYYTELGRDHKVVESWIVRLREEQFL